MMRSDQGFTLLEVLLAMAVLGVVVAMLSLSLSGTLRVVEGTDQQEEMYHQGQIALRRISDDLVAALPSGDVAFTGMKKELDGERVDTLVFASLAHLVFNPDKQKPGIAVIGYQLRPDADDARRLRLLRSDTLLLPGVKSSGSETAESFLLADNLRSVRFSYFDQQGQEFDTWEGAAESDQQQAGTPVLPASVACTLEFWIDPEKRISQAFSTGVLLPAGMIVASAQGAAGVKGTAGAQGAPGAQGAAGVKGAKN